METRSPAGGPAMPKHLAACLLLALVAGNGDARAQPGSAGVPDRIVFIGGVGPRYATLADPGVSAALLRTGKIGLYQHANGNAALTPGQRSALWAAWLDGEGANATVGEVGGGSADEPGYVALFGGRFPLEVNMNTLTNSGDGTGSYRSGAGEAEPGRMYGGYTTAADLAVMQQQICNAVQSGAEDVAVVMTPNGGAEDLADGFAAAPFWANVRAAALFGGGIGLDVPPTYWTLREPAYRAQVTQMVAWANASGIRSSIIVSPHAEKPDAAGHSGGCGYDPAFVQNTRRLVTSLADAGALPTQWVVEDYGAAGPSCSTGNDVAADGQPESLNAAALLLAESAPVSRPAAKLRRALASCGPKQ